MHRNLSIWRGPIGKKSRHSWGPLRCGQLLSKLHVISNVGTTLEAFGGSTSSSYVSGKSFPRTSEERGPPFSHSSLSRSKFKSPRLLFLVLSVSLSRTSGFVRISLGSRPHLVYRCARETSLFPPSLSPRDCIGEPLSLSSLSSPLLSSPNPFLSIH